jgi:dolichol-phosphate mannosyltransferase
MYRTEVTDIRSPKGEPFMKHGITVFMPACREAANLKILLPELVRNLSLTGEPFEIIVIDGPEKTDDSDEVCRQYGAVYLHQREPGWGGAFRTGIRRSRADYAAVLTMDADCSHDPSYIPALWKALQDGADVAVASRYCAGGGTGDAPSSVCMSRFLNGVFYILTFLDGFPVADISGGFRMYRTGLLKSIHTDGRYFDTTIETMIRLGLARKKQGGRLRVKEVPYVFYPRKFGETHRHLASFILSFAALFFKSMLWSVQALRRRHRS